MQTEFGNFSHSFLWEDEITDTACIDYGFNQYEGGTNSAFQSNKLDLMMRNSLQMRIKLADNGNNIEEQEQQHDLAYYLSLSSLNPLRRTSHSNALVHRTEKEEETTHKLSTNQIMEIAAKRFLENKALNKCPNDVNSLPDQMETADKQDAELILHLLAAAEKVSETEYSDASKLLTTDCQRLAAKTGTPVQRVAYCFVDSLLNRIERETTGREVPSSFEQKLEQEGYSARSIWRYNSAILSFYQQYPFFQALRFAGIQAVLECIAMKSKVHLFDIHMRTGTPWAILMQAVAAKRESYPIQHLKITTIQPTTEAKQGLESIENQLRSLAKTLQLFQFSFHFVSVTNFVEEPFVMDPGEVIVVYAPFVMFTGIRRPKCLEKFMAVIRSMEPALMVVTEVEANFNAPSFVNRFIEALFNFGAIFDSLEDGMGREDQKRMDLEEGPLCSAIHNIIATEGKERVTRSVKFDVWKACFMRFGMVSAEISESSLYQASLVVQSSSYGNSCTLEMEANGRNCLVVGWKGTPLFGLSIWRFS